MDYIKLSRKILDWEWYGNINTCRVFIHMLLKAYWKDKKIEGTVIPRGSILPSSVPTDSQTIPERFPTKEEYKEIKNFKKEVPKGTKKKFEPPSVDDVRAYCQERGNGIDPEYFVDFYKAKDWMIGKNKMKDWKAAVRNWEKMDKQKSKAGFANKSKNKFDFETKQDYGDLTEFEKQMLTN